MCDNIYKNFDLPEGEWFYVASEVESHTGIIIQNSHSSFSFAHLSILEYLCAYYILREATPENIRKYLLIKPSIVAIAIAISPNPNRYFIQVIRGNNPEAWIQNANSLFSLLRVEKPSFSDDAELGFYIINYIIKIFGVNKGKSMGNYDERDIVHHLLSIRGVHSCLQKFFSCIRFSHVETPGENSGNEDFYHFNLSKKINIVRTSDLPSFYVVNRSILYYIKSFMNVKFDLDGDLFVDIDDILE